MLPTVRNDLTMSILDRLRKQGMPGKPQAAGGLMGENDGEESDEAKPMDQLGRSLQAGPMPTGLDKARADAADLQKRKKKRLPEEDEEAY